MNEHAFGPKMLYESFLIFLVSGCRYYRGGLCEAYLDEAGPLVLQQDMRSKPGMLVVFR